MAGNLSQLQEIEVTHCRKLEQIVLMESRQVHKNEQISKVEFTQLSTLTLQCLPRLTRFGFNALTPNTRLQEILAEDNPDSFIPFFSQNVLLPRLENLKLCSINVDCRWLDQLQAVSSCCQTLVKLILEECNGLNFLFSYSMVKSLVQLHELEIRNCKSMERIINIEESAAEERIIYMIFPKLNLLLLEGLPKLTRFGSGNSIEFPSLYTLWILDCPRLKMFFSGSTCANITVSKEQEATNSCADIYPLFDKKVSLPSLREFKLNSISSEVIWHSQLLATSSSLHNLTFLRIFGLGDLKYLFSTSMANNLVQLNILEIIDCKLMEAVIAEEVKGCSGVLFPNLRDLTVCNLPKLSRFCYFNWTLIDPCSSLEQNMTASEECSGMEDSKENLQANIQPLFDEKVGFPSLEKMVVSGMDNLMSIWHNRFLGDSFSFHKLISLEVNDCQELMTIFPSCICGRLLSLESLIVKSCGSVKEIFDLRGINLKEKHFIQETTKLRELYVGHLSNLKHIWNADPEGMLSYGKLEKVTVFLCPNLENLFPASVARSLLNLDSLEVSDCGVEEIIAKEGGVKEAATDRFLFPQLSSLQLHNLPQLRTFYPGHTVEGPCLKRLGLHHCDKVTLFISEFLGFYGTIEEGQLDISIHEQPPFFLVQEIEGTNQRFPNLEELQLSGKAIAMRWPSQVPVHVFRSLKSLELNDHESTVVPLDFIQRFGNLEKLSLNSSSYNKEIFSYGKDKEHPEIKHLVLSGLFDLKQIWKQGSKIDPNFQNLQILEVRSCFNLINLMPSSASFRNLMNLEVWGCDGLKNLLTSSTAKSLVLLEKLEVFDCKILTEVIANEGGVPEEIVFGNLKSLSLVYLQSIASFCFTKHTLNFPILESLVVNECPKMKIFSEGVASTPKLHKLELNWKAIEQNWEVGVNTTIQQNMERQ